MTTESVLTKRQRRVLGPRHLPGGQPGEVIKAEVRFDDDCGNGHNTFSVTGETWTTNKYGRKVEGSGGVIHEEIARAFPEIAHLLKWHLCSTDGPMGYPGNVLFFAGDLDYNGRKAGDPSRISRRLRWGQCPVLFKMPNKFTSWVVEKINRPKDDFIILEVPHPPTTGYQFSPKFTFAGFQPEPQWHTCPFDDLAEAKQWKEAMLTGVFSTVEHVEEYSEGKDRELALARSSAIWPDAPFEILTAPREVLKAALMERLPGLLAEFRRDMETFGFVW